MNIDLYTYNCKDKLISYKLHYLGKGCVGQVGTTLVPRVNSVGGHGWLTWGIQVQSPLESQL